MHARQISARSVNQESERNAGIKLVVNFSPKTHLTDKNRSNQKNNNQISVSSEQASARKTGKNTE